MTNPKIIKQLTDLESKLSIIEVEGVVGVDQLNMLKREVANLKLYQDTSERIPAGTVFGSNFLETFGMTIDFAKSRSATSIPSGSASITVADASQFFAGQEVTVYDDENKESVKIQGITNNTLTVTPTNRSYKTGAQVARSTIEKSGAFGKWEENNAGLLESDVRIVFHQAAREVAAFIQHDPEITVTGELAEQPMQAKYREIKSHEMASITTEFIGYDTNYG